VPGVGAADETVVSEADVRFVHLHDIVVAVNPTIKRSDRIDLI